MSSLAEPTALGESMAPRAGVMSMGAMARDETDLSWDLALKRRHSCCARPQLHPFVSPRLLKTD